MLKQKGYRTACIGKWHLGLDWVDTGDWSKGFKRGPTALGFDSYFGIPASLDMNNYAYVESDQVVQLPTQNIAGSPWPAFWRPGKIAPDFHHVEVLPKMADKAVGYLQDQKRAGPGKPFFLYLALPSPHTPHVPMQSMIGKSEAGARGDYVAETDWAVGLVLKALDSLGLMGNTVVIVTSDNGAHDKTYKQYGHTPHMGYRGEKADIFEAGHRIPFLIRWPGVVKAGSISGETICLTDFMATAAAITGYRFPDSAGEDSYSLLPVLLGQKLSGPLREATVHHSDEGTFAIRKGAWKLAVDNMGSGGFTLPDQVAGPGTLFDILKNPGEDSLQDQYAAKPAVVAELRALLDKYKKDGRSTPKNRMDEFWQGPVRVHAAIPVSNRPRLFTRGGNELRLEGAGNGVFQIALVAMNGRQVWKGIGNVVNGEAGVTPGHLEPGLYSVVITGQGWTLRESLLTDVSLLDVMSTR
jgi:arylsulfatase A